MHWGSRGSRYGAWGVKCRVGAALRRIGRRAIGLWRPRGELSPFLLSVYHARPDVAAVFPDVHGRDREQFIQWARVHGSREMGFFPWLVEDPTAPADAAIARSTRDPTGTSAELSGVNVSGYLRNETGVGAVARGYIAALRAAGIPHALNDFSELSPNRSEDPTLTRFDPHNPFQVNLICANPEHHAAFSEHLGQAYFRDRYNVGVWFWELPRFPEAWWDLFAHYDEIWAASTFIANTLAPIAPVPVVRIPAVLTPGSYGSRARGRQRLGLTDNPFVYLFIFDFRSTFQRKNPLAAIEAFKRAFVPGAAAHLVIKSVNGGTRPSELASLRAQAAGYPISIYDGYWPVEEIRDLVAACDAYVSLHRSEGLGLTIADAMAHGKPVIATGWSGNTDFTNVSNSFLVRFGFVELTEHHGPYLAGHTWADPSVEHAAELLRYVFEHRDVARSVGAAAKLEIETNFSRDRVGSLIRDRLAAIERRSGVTTFSGRSPGSRG